MSHSDLTSSSSLVIGQTISEQNYAKMCIKYQTNSTQDIYTCSAIICSAATLVTDTCTGYITKQIDNEYVSIFVIIMCQNKHEQSCEILSKITSRYAKSLMIQNLQAITNGWNANVEDWIKCILVTRSNQVDNIKHIQRHTALYILEIYCPRNCVVAIPDFKSNELQTIVE